MSLENLKHETFFESTIDYNQPPSNRREARQRVLLRAHIHAIDRQGDIRVTDLSRSCMRGVTDLCLGIDQSIFVSLDDITHYSGNIRWTEGRRVGLKFAKRLELLPDNLIMDTGILPSHWEQAPQIVRNILAKITLSNASATAKIRNISKSGMMIETDMRLNADKQLLISLSNGKILEALVKWVEGDRVGVELSNPVSVTQFSYGGLA